MARSQKRKRPHKRADKAQEATALRIVGGHFRGRKLQYAGDKRVRPMKDRVREALFNLLGPAVKGLFAIDLFGGTGALALEAISRGAVGALIVERHIPTAKVIRQNITMLELDEVATLVVADTFAWSRRDVNLPQDPWVVFVSPPYLFFTERTAETMELISTLLNRAPVGSLFAIEATNEFDFESLPHPEVWDIRAYPPAILAVLVVTDSLRGDASVGSD
jgi:16S rRNA (guanine966-N2)-methyltransferase